MPLITGRYRLGESLGQGGMGRVWRARDEVLERDVAVKEVLNDSDAAHRRTLREARAAARLSHPNVVQVFDVLEVDGKVWIVMEYVPSRSLQEVLHADGPLEPRRVARIGLELLAALRASHRAGVDHRDVKPANVLLADDGRVLLTDFGIATIEGDAGLSSSDMVLGSPEYMSPERAKTGTAGMASDLWSLGATLYAAVEGQSPFHRGSAIATLTALAADEPDPPHRAGVLEPLLTGLLQKNPANRINATEAEHLLRAAASGSYGHAPVVRVDTPPNRNSLPPAIPAQSQPSPVSPAPEAPAPMSPALVSPAPEASAPDVPALDSPDAAKQTPDAPATPAPGLAPFTGSAAAAAPAPAEPIPAQRTPEPVSAPPLPSEPVPAQLAPAAPDAAPDSAASVSATPASARPASATPEPAEPVSAEPVSAEPDPAALNHAAENPAASVSATPPSARPAPATPEPAEPVSAEPDPAALNHAAQNPAASVSATPTPSRPAPVTPKSVEPMASPDPAAAGSRGSHRTRLALAAAVAVLLLAGIVWLVVRAGADSAGDRNPSGAPPAQSAPATGSAQASTDPSASTSADAGAPGSPSAAESRSPSPATSRTTPPATTAQAGSTLPRLPDGWRDYRDATGFAVYVPEGWTRSKEGSIVYFRDSSSGRVLGIDQTRQPEPDPVADWRGKADYRVSVGDFPNYREIHIKEVDYFRKAADWEFTFTRNGTRQHVNNRGVITASDQAYGFYWQTRDADWSRYRDDLQLIFDSFRPARR
ncbi:hypothetical protein Ade02nite_36740 [Paractinoplanes deccanensis]|uniref:Protein kinase domain-containing protein n=1 Tax=Paractinoplanes deccanensis TaxID=113561 RepID=A0ABQ3Y4X4_9ACTN|nr:serine/threonine-protein kinase [Actinoplanes deccanensis]GID75033.1 hypothetical protein Ade02nite_36740 [Actinoplanes deccanensis]